MEWVLTHWMEIAGVLALVVGVAIAILRLVPGDQGEQPGGWLDRVRSFLSLITGGRAGSSSAALSAPKPDEEEPLIVRRSDRGTDEGPKD